MGGGGGWIGPYSHPSCIHWPRCIKCAFERKSEQSYSNWVLTNHNRALRICVWFFWLALKRKFYATGPLYRNWGFEPGTSYSGVQDHSQSTTRTEFTSGKARLGCYQSLHHVSFFETPCKPNVWLIPHFCIPSSHHELISLQPTRNQYTPLCWDETSRR